MKSPKTLIVAAALAAVGFNASADVRDFTIANNTPWTIQSVYVSQSNANIWGQEVLGRDHVLGSGASTKLDFNSVSDSSCMWDVRIVLSGDADMNWRQINACRLVQMTIDYDFVRKTYLASWNNIQQ